MNSEDILKNTALHLPPEFHKRRQWVLYFDRLWEMGFCEWKLREQSTIYGFLWTLLNPLLTFAVLYVVFTKWMGAKVGNYASFLLIGVVQYGFFNLGTSYGLSSLRRRSGVIMNFILPIEIVMFSTVLSVAISHFFEFCLMLLFIMVMGVRPTLSWIALPFIFMLLVAMILSLSLFLSILDARYQDFERIWGIVVSTGFFLTPIFYTMDIITPSRRRFLWLNPMTSVIDMTRQAALQGKFPNIKEFGGILIFTVLLAVFGGVFFRKQESKIADYISV